MKRIFLATAFILTGALLAWANVNEIKLYKEAFPDAKPKCINCHVDALPKKDEGKHEANAYGKAIKEQAAKEQAIKEAKPTVETYKAVGPVEKFQPK